MRSRLALAAALGTLVALAGCANQPMPGENPTPARSEPLATPPTGASSGGGTVATYGATTPPDPAAGVTVQGEDGTTTTEVSSEQRQADAEDCYTYAHASVGRDIQVQDDREAIFDQSSNNRDVYAFTNRLDEFGNEQRLKSLYADCMAAKGYAAAK